MTVLRFSLFSIIEIVRREDCAFELRLDFARPWRQRGNGKEDDASPFLFQNNQKKYAGLARTGLKFAFRNYRCFRLKAAKRPVHFRPRLPELAEKIY